jgi:hypothetical protein
LAPYVFLPDRLRRPILLYRDRIQHLLSS